MFTGPSVQSVKLFSAMCIFECFSLLMFWACLISPFTCCVTSHYCALKLLFSLHVHTYGCPLEHQFVSLFSVVSTLVTLRFWHVELVLSGVVLHAITVL